MVVRLWASVDIGVLEELGLNRNEAKVYLALVRKGQATAAELVRAVGVHRNIIYDNLEKLTEKGLVSFIVDGNRRRFTAEDPQALIEYLQSQQEVLVESTVRARQVLPEIRKLLGSARQKQDATVFVGVKGLKKVLLEIGDSREYWSIGVTNESVELLGETFWKNFNARIAYNKTKEHLLLNPDFRNTVNIKKSTAREFRRLPQELNQVTEIMLYRGRTAIVVYSATPVVTIIDDPHVFATFQRQFAFLWKRSR